MAAGHIHEVWVPHNYYLTQAEFLQAIKSYLAHTGDLEYVTVRPKQAKRGEANWVALIQEKSINTVPPTLGSEVMHFLRGEIPEFPR